MLVYRQNEFSSNISLHFKLGAKRRKKIHNVRAADPTHPKKFLLIVCLYLPSFLDHFSARKLGLMEHVEFLLCQVWTRQARTHAQV